MLLTMVLSAGCACIWLRCGDEQALTSTGESIDQAFLDQVSKVQGVCVDVCVLVVLGRFRVVDFLTWSHVGVRAWVHGTGCVRLVGTHPCARVKQQQV